MNFDTNKLCGRSFAIFAACNVLTYIFAHVAYIFMNDTVGEIFEYISLYVSKISDFLIPTSIATVALLLYAYKSFKSAALFALSASSARVFFTLPYYYIIFIYNYGYDSVEAISFSLLASVLIILLTAGGALLSLGVALFFIKRTGRKKDAHFYERSFLQESLQSKSASNFLDGANLALLIFCLLCFITALITEIYDTVSFFIEYGLDYTLLEIITIMCNYILIFAMVAISYIVTSVVKNNLISKRLKQG